MTSDEPEVFEASCLVCGSWGEHRKEEGRPTRETYVCAHCHASLRYRAQAGAILRHFGRPHRFRRSSARSIAELVHGRRFRSLSIYEPGFIGPFRRYFRNLPHYIQSRYPASDEGNDDRRASDVECQDLMALTFGDRQFDLVISSDIFEHVREPYKAFQEIHRVLKNGGMHIFTVPFLTTRAKTVYRVDTSGPEDIVIEPPRYHGSPATGRSLLYTDFGLDMLDELSNIGLPTELHEVETPHAALRWVVAFASTKIA